MGTRKLAAFLSKPKVWAAKIDSRSLPVARRAIRGAIRTNLSATMIFWRTTSRLFVSYP